MDPDGTRNPVRLVSGRSLSGSSSCLLRVVRRCWYASRSQSVSDPNPAKAQAVVQAMLKMDKIIVADLQKAHSEG